MKAGRVEFRVDKTSLIHIPIGKLSFTPEQLLQNLASAIDAIVRAKPTGAKGQYVKSIVICLDDVAERPARHRRDAGDEACLA